MRMYPAQVNCQQHKWQFSQQLQYWSSAEEYDARFESWYVGAASGPKDVVLIIDTSGSMEVSNRMQIAKEAAHLILNTLTPDDFVNIIQFNSDASRFDCFPNKLVRATPENIAKLHDFVDSLYEFVDNFVHNSNNVFSYATGSTNYEAAFNLAFDMLDATIADPNAGTDCESVILFLTDGEPTVGQLE